MFLAVQPYRYNGKELDRTRGLDRYYYGARMFDAAAVVWRTQDSLAEKYRNLSPYDYCGNNPVNRFDPDGMDWYQDTDKTWQFSPDVHSQKDLREGQVYKGKSFVKKKGTLHETVYRTDGSILYANETDAYNRIWSQADTHYRLLGEKRGRESGGFILANGTVLVLPEYKNDINTSDISGYDYKLDKNGYVTKGKEKFKVLANIHTHQRGAGNPTPSDYPLSNSDLGISKNMGGWPVLTMGHDNMVYGVFYNRQGKCEHFSVNKLHPLLRGQYKIYPWLKQTKFR